MRINRLRRGLITLRPQKVGLYDSPSEALKDVRSHYQGWTKGLTETSIQLSYAVIAANWAVFGSVDKLLGNPWSECSVAIVLCGLGLNLVGTWWLCRLLKSRIDKAENNRTQWASEFVSASGRRDPFPYTTLIDQVASGLRIVKTVFPIAAGVLFIFAILAPVSQSGPRSDPHAGSLVPLHALSSLKN